ncbi:hypothetical protein EV1_010712 [Malus domestica]
MSYSGTRVKHQNIPEGIADNGRIRKFDLGGCGKNKFHRGKTDTHIHHLGGDVGAHILMEEVTPEVMIVTMVVAMQAGSPMDLKFL